MDNILSRLKQLTPDELREEIVKAGQKCGPITLTTRSIFEKRLAQSLWEEQGEAAVSNGVPGTTTADNGQLETNKPPVNQNGHVSASEDADFGYSMGLNPPEEEALMHKMGPGSIGEVAGVDSPTSLQSPSKESQQYYGVCPVYDDILARNGNVFFVSGNMMLLNCKDSVCTKRKIEKL